MVGAAVAMAMLLVPAGPPAAPAAGSIITVASPGADTATGPSTQAPSASYGAPGADTSPNATAPGPGTVTGSPGGDSSPVGESPGGSARPSNTSR